MNFLRQSARSAPSLASRAFSTSSAAGSVARMTLVGRVGSDPEIKELPSGVHVAEYSVAANNFKDKTSWFKVSVFGEKDIEFLRNYVRKGYVYSVAFYVIISPVGSELYIPSVLY